MEAIEKFFYQKKPDDLIVLYFSGHGLRDEYGALYLAVKNTNRNHLRSTAIKSDFIREIMDHCRSKRQLLILDCCYSGAFSHGTKAAIDVSIGTANNFEGGFGRIILTASDSTQFSWEGDKIIGGTNNSLFTHYLVEGLRGSADIDGDGRITVDNLYDYVYAKVKLATPGQTPSKFSSKQQGEVVLRQNMRIEDIKYVPLPDSLLRAIENSYVGIRLGAVDELTKLLSGRNLGLARTARETLQQILTEDDSRKVSHAAKHALEAIQQDEKLTPQKVIEGRVAINKLKVEINSRSNKKEEVKPVEKLIAKNQQLTIERIQEAEQSAPEMIEIERSIDRDHQKNKREIVKESESSESARYAIFLAIFSFGWGVLFLLLSLRSEW